MINRLIMDIISRLWILYDKLHIYIYHPFFTHLSMVASPAAPLAAPPWWHSPSARCAASTSAGPAPLPPATAPAPPPPGPPRRSRGRCLKCWAEQKGTKNRENMWKWTRKWWMLKRNFAEFGCFSWFDQENIGIIPSKTEILDDFTINNWDLSMTTWDFCNQIPQFFHWWLYSHYIAMILPIPLNPPRNHSFIGNLHIFGTIEWECLILGGRD